MDAKKFDKLSCTRLWSRGSMNYHVSDRNGRFYLCGCMRAFRINGIIKHPVFQKGFRKLNRLSKRWSLKI